MERTYLDYFNFYLKQFLNEIISYFPYTKREILLNYRQLLEEKDNKNDLYVKYYMTKVNDHLGKISKKDPTLFENQVLYFVEGVNFHDLYNSSDSTDNNKQAIWKYLQLLVLLGRRCLPNKSDIVKMLEMVGGVIEEPREMDKTLEKKTNDDDEEPQEDAFGLGGLLKGLGSLSKLGGAGGEGGLNLGDLGESFSAITKLAGSLSEGLKDVNMEELTKQMAESFGNLDLGQNSEDAQMQDVDDVVDGEASADSSTTSSTGSNSNSTQPGGTSAAANNLGNSSLFTDLAEEMSNTFNFDELENDADSETPPNIGDALGQFMKGDNPAKFMNLISKFSTRLQTDLKSGKVNQGDLLNQTNQMMGNLDQMGMNSEEVQEQANKMFGENSPQANKVKNQNRNSAARDRLRKKLAEKKLKEQANE